MPKAARACAGNAARFGHHDNMTWPPSDPRQQPPHPHGDQWLPQPPAVQLQARPDTGRDRRAPKSWGKEFVRFVAAGAVSAAIWTGLLALARTGLMRDRQWDPIVADPLFAGILAFIVSMLWAMYIASRESRSVLDLGRRLPSLAAVGTVAAALAATLVMMVWPWLLVPSVADGSVATEVGRAPAATLAVFLFVTAANGWFLALFVLLTSWGELGWSIAAALGIVFAFLVAIFAAGIAGAVLFENPVSTPGLAGLVLAAASGVGIAGMAGWLVSGLRSGGNREARRSNWGPW